jgi:hypothetical protein
MSNLSTSVIVLESSTADASGTPGGSSLLGPKVLPGHGVLPRDAGRIATLIRADLGLEGHVLQDSFWWRQ